MCLPVHLEQLRRVDVRVALRRRELYVSEQLLNRTQIRPCLQQVRRERMSQRMRADAESRAARRDVTRDQALDAATRQARAAEVDE